MHRAVVWPEGGPGVALITDDPIDGPCTVGSWSGTLNPLTEGNVSADPVYTSTGVNPNLRLASQSPAIDVCPDPAMLDLDGLERAFPAGGNAEPGAFERH